MKTGKNLFAALFEQIAVTTKEVSCSWNVRVCVINEVRIIIEIILPRRDIL